MNYSILHQKKNSMIKHELTKYQRIKLIVIVVVLLMLLFVTVIAPKNSLFTTMLVFGFFCGTKVLKDLKFKL